MKLRRALAAVTATAAIAPAALLAAPAAYAAEPPGQTPTATASAATPSTPTPTSGATGPSGTPAPDGSSKPPQGGGGTTTGAPVPPKGAVPGKNTESGPGVPTATPTTTPTAAPECEDWSSERSVRAELRGLPSKIVAGSGWVDFTYRATNISTGRILSVEAYAQVFALDNKTSDDVSSHLSLEWFDASTGRWKPVAGPEEGDGYFASIGDADGLRPGEYAEARLRLKADARTPASYGGAVSVGWYLNADLKCGFSESADYPFDILPAGSTAPGHVPDSQGKPGTRPNHPAPQGGKKQQARLPVTGQLAETGTSSGLPALALSGAAAVAVGAGAVFAVRRRKGADAA
ncbi:LPXTG cell wall anchor domain-containing protein [Streptomyces sp. NPDC052496]|uniref:LPXTG cell wall anchor domain-containing protein n=1 Tax=Streptomyces sp. NPDC052496 TaxID=3154951 RepID=UPI00343A7AA9